MERKRDSTTSARAIQECKRVKEKDDDEPKSRQLGTTTTIVDLPSAITNNILLQLPIKSVLICRCVCRTWNALISDPLFAKLQFERAQVGLLIRTNDTGLVSRTLHLLDPESDRFDESECNNQVKLEPKFKLPLRGAKLVLENKDETDPFITYKPDDRFELVNSCNGLLCLRDPWTNGDPSVVCNPVTGEFIRLPQATGEFIRLPQTSVVEKPFAPKGTGFGFQPKTNEYKVIIIRRWWIDTQGRISEGVAVEIHTLGTQTWRNVGLDPRFSIFRLQFPTCVNGALHWINIDVLMKPSILCFNFESERLQYFPPPPHMLGNNRIHNGEHIGMGESRSFLYICDASFPCSVEMWVMKEYGIGESWTKVFTFSIDTFCVPIVYPYGLCWSEKHFKKGTAILMQRSNSDFVYYEPEKHKFKFFNVRGTESNFLEAISHVPSLISLKDVVKGYNIEVLNVHSRCAKFKLAEESKVLYLTREEEYDEEYTS